MITYRGHEIDHHAVWITEGEDVLLVAGARWIRVDPELLEAFVPVPECGLGHAERRRSRHSGTAATLRTPWPRKESKQARRAALLVSVVQVISVGCIEVDCLLHQSQAERSGVEV